MRGASVYMLYNFKIFYLLIEKRISFFLQLLLKNYTYDNYTNNFKNYMKIYLTIYIYIYIYMFTIRCTTLLPPFFSEIRDFIVKNWLYIYDSKYCPSLATTFSHLSGSVRIPRRKNWSSFEVIHESIQFFISS